MEKIGLAITTFNSESYFDDLYKTIPFDKLDEIVVVNGGQPYNKKYEGVTWIQHDQVKYPSVARNDGLKFLLEKNIQHFFICEDDMLIKNSDIFNLYIDAYKHTGIPYYIYSSVAWESGQKGQRTPKIQVEYPDNTVIKFNANMCNEFTYKNVKLIQDVGLYDENFKYTFDVDYAYRVSKRTGIPFWYFPDMPNSDDLIDNNSNAVSRLDSDGLRITRLGPDYDYFAKKHGINIQTIPSLQRDILIENLKIIKSNV